MKSDFEIQRDVMEQLRWEPFLNSSQIGVAVRNGVVTLSGQVDAFSKKLAAEKAAKSVAGVKAVAEDIQVGLSPAFRKTDTEIAEAVLNALKWHSGVNEEKIKIRVEDGVVRLEGEVNWIYEKRNVESAIQHLTGVRSLVNLISIRPNVTGSEIQQKISAAFHRSATIDSAKISAEVTGSKVVLKGRVRSIAEKEDAETAAWNAPGVTTVESRVEVEVPEYAFED